MARQQPTLWRAATLLLAASLLTSAAALAQETPASDAPSRAEPSGCAAFKWSLDKERQSFAAADLEAVASGAARGPLKQQAFALTLQPDDGVPYTLPPRRKRKDAGRARFGGILAFSAPDKPGTYQVTLSSEGWIDLVQQGARLKSADHSGVKDCDGLRKSVRFKVGAAPLVLQISGAPAASIKVAIRPVE